MKDKLIQLGDIVAVLGEQAGKLARLADELDDKGELSPVPLTYSTSISESLRQMSAEALLDIVADLSGLTFQLIGVTMQLHAVNALHGGDDPDPDEDDEAWRRLLGFLE